VTTLARIPADVSKRLLILMCAAALVTAACNNFPVVNVSYGKGQQFVPYVADNLDDAGLGAREELLVEVGLLGALFYG